MSEIIKALNKKIAKSLNNNFGIENYDEYRFGKYKANDSSSNAKHKIKILKIYIKKLLNYNANKDIYITRGNELIKPYLKEFQNIWDNTIPKDRELVVSLLAYRVLGYTKVKLRRNNKEYHNSIVTAKMLCDFNDTFDPKFLHFILKKINLKKIGYDIQFYFTEKGVANDFILEQYAYKLNQKNIISADKGDVVLDIGGCWGDTALYFAHNVGEKGKVYSFEFIPNNLKIFKKNISINPILSRRIDLIENPISNESDDIIYFRDKGPSSRVEFNEFDGYSGVSRTISVDDFVKNNNIKEVNFIKMDIEGAEPLALEGAIETIKRFKPKLAISIYHSIDDFATIPNWILSLNLNYEIFIDHFTIHSEETICFARIK